MIKISSFSLFLAILPILAACGPTGPTTPTLPPETPARVSTSTPLPPTITATPTATSTRTVAPSATASPVPPTATLTATTAPTPPPGPLSGAALVEALRGGGYVIYIRHAATTQTPDDANPVVLTDCTTQRNLSAEGQAQGRSIGQAFQQLGIPVGRVLASPFCRTMDTARLAFGRVEIEPALENLETSADEAKREARIAGLRRLLSNMPEPGTNTVLASHGFNISAAAQITISEGEAAIFRPNGSGSFELVATVEPDEWAALLP